MEALFEPGSAWPLCRRFLDGLGWKNSYYKPRFCVKQMLKPCGCKYLSFYFLLC